LSGSWVWVGDGGELLRGENGLLNGGVGRRRQFIVERGPLAFLHVDVPNDHEIFIVIGGSFNILNPPGALKSTMHNSVNGGLFVPGFSFGFFTGNKFA
jgi:hypothetical protein